MNRKERNDLKHASILSELIAMYGLKITFKAIWLALNKKWST